MENKESIILGIESSCDDTAIAIYSSTRGVLSSVISSQYSSHQEFGGVVPEIASREHLKSISLLTQKCLSDSGIEDIRSSIDAIAVTQGPGLIGSLLVGISFAKGLAFINQIPLIPINHIHGHIYSAFLDMDEQQLKNQFPALALVVSGGHTNLYAMQDPLDFNCVGRSVDDACGESFDKVAKLLGMPYPGGPQIQKAAAGGNPKQYSFPKTRVKKGPLYFSYSGLKTFVYNALRDNPIKGNDELTSDLCAGFQEAAINQLFDKIQHALFPGCKSLIICGGVAANAYFRDKLKQFKNLKTFIPEMRFCSDNAAMIARLGLSYYSKENWQNPQPFDWSAFSKYNFQID